MENGCWDSLNSTLRDELLKGELSYSLAEPRIVIEGWRQHCNTRRPHASLGDKPPAPPAALAGCINPTRFACHLNRGRKAHRALD